MGGGLTPDGRAALRRLDNLGKIITGDARSELERAALRAAQKTRDAILRAETRHPGDLRAEIAATVSVTSRTGRDNVTVEIKSNGRRMPPGESTLPAHANRGRWRHPVFARADQARDEWTWRPQTWQTAQDWFDGTLGRERANFTAAARRGMDAAARDAGRG